MTDVDTLNIVKKRQMDNLMGEMKELVPLFENKCVTNIYITQSGRIIYDDFINGKVKTELYFEKEKVMKIIYFIASMQNETIDQREFPVLETLLPEYNFRLEAVIWPWVDVPQLTIRRPHADIIPLEKWLEEERISKDHYDKLIELIQQQKNIIICGAVGSGKTTFMNSCIQRRVDLWPNDRILVIEDTPEIVCKAEDCTMLHIRTTQIEKANSFSLRWTMQVVIFGEIRTGIMLKGALTAMQEGGHGSFSTLHANSAKDAKDRMLSMVDGDKDAQNTISKVIGAYVHLSDKKVDEVLSMESIDNLDKAIEQYEAQTRKYEDLYGIIDQNKATGGGDKIEQTAENCIQC